jgi:peroxiredoxin Q/BCP
MAKKKSRAKAKAKPKRKTKTKAKTKARVRAKTKSRSVKSRVSKKTAAPKMAAPTIASATTLPDLEVQTTNGGRLRLSSLKGKNVVLYFYPKDDTPGCTVEGCDIRDRFGNFQQLNAVVLGVSRDDLGSHERFKAKFGFPFELVTDPDEKLCRAFNVIQQKSLYGKTYMGVDRSTFIFDKSGKLRKEFRSVKVEGHADEILNTLKAL